MIPGSAVNTACSIPGSRQHGMLDAGERRQLSNLLSVQTVQTLNLLRLLLPVLLQLGRRALRAPPSGTAGAKSTAVGSHREALPREPSAGQRHAPHEPHGHDGGRRGKENVSDISVPPESVSDSGGYRSGDHHDVLSESARARVSDDGDHHRARPHAALAPLVLAPLQQQLRAPWAVGAALAPLVLVPLQQQLRAPWAVAAAAVAAAAAAPVRCATPAAVLSLPPRGRSAATARIQRPDQGTGPTSQCGTHGMQRSGPPGTCSRAPRTPA